MVIALLAVLGVDLIVIVLFAAVIIGRRQWLMRQPGEFKGSIRVSSGDFHGLKSKWKRGSGRWVRDVLVWSKGPFMFRNELVPVDRQLAERKLDEGEVKRLGDDPVALQVESGDATIEVATRAQDRALLVAPWANRNPTS